MIVGDTQAEALNRLAQEDAPGQLRHREATMAALGSESGDLKLDWVEGIARLLADQTLLEEVEEEARTLWRQGIRHLIWAGMGGSIITVRVLDRMGFCDGQQGSHVAIYPLDSTDPAALNAIMQRIAQAKQLTLPTSGTTPDAAWLRSLLGDVMMVGVSMGMTSEEPITHLTWFTALLEQAQFAPAEHLLVMTLPGSYLDQFAHEQQAPSRPLQLDRGTGTGGRMSAPTTRVFLLPAALYLTRLADAPGQLRAVLSEAWSNYDLDLATERPADHPFVQLAAALYAASTNGACRMLLEFPARWQALVAWIEQLMEESLGKGKKGVIAFYDQPLNHQAPAYRPTGTLRVRVTADTAGATNASHFILRQPSLSSDDPRARLAAAATSFLGWQLTMALYGYLHQITFAGQPAVENYKARARALRTLDDPLQVLQDWPATYRAERLALLAPSRQVQSGSPALVFAAAIKQALAASDEQARLGYLDFTVNGEISSTLRQAISTHLHRIGNTLLGVPVKLRQAPADYHSTEQSEMDGPPYLVSLRLLLRNHEAVTLGSYSDAFLRAQAVSTWQAMIEQGRSCFLLLADGSPDQAGEALKRFLTSVADALRA